MVAIAAVPIRTTASSSSSASASPAASGAATNPGPPIFVTENRLARISAIVVPRRRRESKPKVRTGCGTCKKRHVKCDEAKPICNRCQTAGTECSGYSDPAASAAPRRKKSSPDRTGNGASTRPLLPVPEESAPRRCRDAAAMVSTAPLIRPRPVSVSVFASEADTLYFDLFQNQIVKDLSGFWMSNFWSRTVLRAVMLDECVRHSVLALGALSHALHFSPDRLPGWQLRVPEVADLLSKQAPTNKHYKAALNHHMRAVSMFRARMVSQKSSISSRSVLIATLLFVAYELMQGNTDAADGLLISSVTLLRDSIKVFSSPDHKQGWGKRSLIQPPPPQMAASERSPLLSTSLPPSPSTSISSFGSASAFPLSTPSPPALAVRPRTPFSHLISPVPAPMSAASHPDDNDDDDDMVELEHLLPRASIMNGFTPFFRNPFPMAELATSPYLDVPDPERMSVDRILLLWSDYCTRAMIFISKHVWLNLQFRPFDMEAARRERGEYLERQYRWRELIAGMLSEAEERGVGSSSSASAGTADLFPCLFPDNMDCPNNYNRGDSNDNKRPPTTPEQVRSLRLIQIHNLLAIIFLRGCLDGTGLTYDTALPDFRTLLARSAALLKDEETRRPGAPVSRIGFTFDIGLVPMLGFVISSCRVLEVRLEAMRYFRQLSWREGAWDARALAIGKSALIRLEHAGADASGWVPPSSRYTWTGASWDVGRRKLLAEYTRLVPDEMGQPVKVSMVLDI